MNLNNASFEKCIGTAAQLPPSDLPETAFSGRSNVGKSSLINRLLNRKSLARTSSVPGKTRTINFYLAGDIRLADLPGYGYAKAALAEKKRWSTLAETYFSTGRNIRLVVQLIDMRHPPSADDVQMLKFLMSGNYNFVVALTKSDKLGKTKKAERLSKLPEELPFLKNTRFIPFSAETGEGADDLRKLIFE